MCFALVVIQMAQCAVSFERIGGQETDENDFILRQKPIMDPTQNDERKPDPQTLQRGFCCSGRDTDCCCVVGGIECVVKGSGHPCHIIHGSWDCKGCSHGWRC